MGNKTALTVTLGKIAHDAGKKAGGWSRSWESMPAGQRNEWEILAAAVAGQTKAQCAEMVTLSPSDIRLMAGEMSAQEMRTVQAVLGGLAAKIRNS